MQEVFNPIPQGTGVVPGEARLRLAFVVLYEDKDLLLSQQRVPSPSKYYSTSLVTVWGSTVVS